MRTSPLPLGEADGGIGAPARYVQYNTPWYNRIWRWMQNEIATDAQWLSGHTDHTGRKGGNTPFYLCGFKAASRQLPLDLYCRSGMKADLICRSCGQQR